MYKGFWWGNLRERDNLEHLGVDGRTVIKWEGKDLIHLDQYRNWWRALVNALMNSAPWS
jgi:hypothetical protein